MSLLFFGKTLLFFFLTCKHKVTLPSFASPRVGVIRLSASALSSLMGQILFCFSRFAHEIILIFPFFLPWCLSSLYFLPSLPSQRMLACHAHPGNIFLLSLWLWMWIPLCIYVSSHSRCPAPVDLRNISKVYLADDAKGWQCFPVWRWAITAVIPAERDVCVALRNELSGSAGLELHSRAAVCGLRYNQLVHSGKSQDKKRSEFIALRCQ